MERRRNASGQNIPGTEVAINNVYLNGKRIASMDASAKTYFYLADNVDSVKVVTNDIGEAVSRTEYLPYGETFATESQTQPPICATDPTDPSCKVFAMVPKYNGQSLDPETMLYFYNARHYDPEIARFVTADTVVDGQATIKGWNRYMYVHGNPIMYKDPTGHNVYSVVWQSKDGETGHAGMAVDNYKKVNGKYVKDGTLTYYDLWPKKPVGKTELQDGVTPDYNKRIIKSLKDLKDNDPSISNKKGHVSEGGEGRSPDNIVQLKTNYKQDKLMKSKADQIIKAKPKYNASANNCSTFVQNVLRPVFKKFNASQRVKATRVMKKLFGYKDADIVAPNNLHNKAASQKNSKTIKGKQNIQAKPYLEYFK